MNYFGRISLSICRKKENSFFIGGKELIDLQDIKLLAINDIEPNPENIASGQYPFTTTLYEITLKDNEKKEIEPFLKWMTGPQGQEIVEKIGYIKENE